MLVTGIHGERLQGPDRDSRHRGRHQGRRHRTGLDGDREGNRAAGVPTKKGDPQPVVFHRQGVDNRPLALRHEHAAARYRSDGDPDHDEAA